MKQTEYGYWREKTVKKIKNSVISLYGVKTLGKVSERKGVLDMRVKSKAEEEKKHGDL